LEEYFEKEVKQWKDNFHTEADLTDKVHDENLELEKEIAILKDENNHLKDYLLEAEKKLEMKSRWIDRQNMRRQQDQ